MAHDFRQSIQRVELRKIVLMIEGWPVVIHRSRQDSSFGGLAYTRYSIYSEHPMIKVETLESSLVIDHLRAVRARMRAGQFAGLTQDPDHG